VRRFSAETHHQSYGHRRWPSLENLIKTTGHQHPVQVAVQGFQVGGFDLLGDFRGRGTETLGELAQQGVPCSLQFALSYPGFRNGWQNLIWFVVGLVNVWPFVLIVAGLVFLFIRWRRKVRRKKIDKQAD